MFGSSLPPVVCRRAHARAGFYHSRNSGETNCFSCGIAYNKYKSGGDLVAVHKKLSSACNQVNNARTNHSFVVENSNRVESRLSHSTSVPSIGISIQQQVANNHKSTTTTATESQTTTTSGLNNADSTNRNLKEKRLRTEMPQGLQNLIDLHCMKVKHIQVMIDIL